LDASNNAPKQSSTTGYGGNTPSVTGNAQVYYANTAIGAYIEKAAIGVFGVDTAEQANVTSSTGKPQHAGWVIRKVGTGPVVSITANAGAVSNSGFIVFTAGNGIAGSGNTTANVTITSNAAGYIQSLTINNPGLYANTPLAVSNDPNSNAVFTVTLGGRAGRVETETIVAMGSMTGDNETVF
jgi:hypothetical protein